MKTQIATLLTLLTVAACGPVTSELSLQPPAQAQSTAQDVYPVGWIGDRDFVLVQGYSIDHQGDRDPAYYFDRMAGSRGNSWLEVQVWIPGLSDSLNSPPDFVRAQAVSNALPLGDGQAFDPATEGAVDLSFVRRQGNNFVYRFNFNYLHINTFYTPTLPDGLYSYYYRFSTDNGQSFTDDRDQGLRRFVVATDLDCSLFPDHRPSACPVDQPIDWAGNWGGRLNHACNQTWDLPDPLTLTKSALGHDCMTVNAEVYVAGLTDNDADPAGILAEVETNIGYDGGPLQAWTHDPLSFETRVGNNYRYQWQLSEHVGRADRGDYQYRFRFSADGGQHWRYLGGEGQDFRGLLIRNDSLDVDPVGSDHDADNEAESLIQWHSAFAYEPTTLDSAPSSHSNVQEPGGGACSLYVNSFGLGQWSHNQSHARWVEGYVSTAEPAEQVVRVGLFAQVQGAEDNAPRAVFSFGDKIDPNYWRVGLTLENNLEFDDSLIDFAFFVDVTLQDGSLQRRWLSNLGNNYTLDQVFAVDGFHLGIGSGDIHYANELDPSISLFDHRRFCQQ